MAAYKLKNAGLCADSDMPKIISSGPNLPSRGRQQGLLSFQAPHPKVLNICQKLI